MAKRSLADLAAATPPERRGGKLSQIDQIEGLLPDLVATIQAELKKPAHARHTIASLYRMAKENYPALNMRYHRFWTIITERFAYRAGKQE